MVKRKHQEHSAYYRTAETYHLEQLFPSISYRYYHGYSRPDLHRGDVGNFDNLKKITEKNENIRLIFSRRHTKITHPGIRNCNVADPTRFTVLQTLISKLLIEKDEELVPLAEIIDFIEPYWQFLRKNIAPPFNESCRQAVVSTLRMSTYNDDRLFQSHNKEETWRLHATSTTKKAYSSYSRREQGSGAWLGRRKRNRTKREKKHTESPEKDGESSSGGQRHGKRNERRIRADEDSPSEAKSNGTKPVPKSPQYDLEDSSIIKNNGMEHHFKARQGKELSELQIAVANVIQDNNGFASLELISKKLEEFGVVPKTSMEELLIEELQSGGAFRKYQDDWMISRRVTLIEASSSSSEDEIDEDDEEGNENGESHEDEENDKKESQTQDEEDDRKEEASTAEEDTGDVTLDEESEKPPEMKTITMLFDLIETYILDEGHGCQKKELLTLLEEKWKNFSNLFNGRSKEEVLEYHLQNSEGRFVQLSGSDDYHVMKRDGVRSSKRRKMLRK